MKDTDRLIHQFEMNTTDVLLLFTNKGSYIYCPVHHARHTAGKTWDSILRISFRLTVMNLSKSHSIKEFDETSYLLFFTKGGMVKKTELLQYKARHYSKPLYALNLKGTMSSWMSM
ncbi:DNA gyrase C-terminal beta-propeller domain-containing protein [Bacillus sp. SL00103]